MNSSAAGGLAVMGLGAAAVIVCLSETARAETTPAPSTTGSPRRALPDYSGRAPQPPTAGELALWVPRVLLSPGYFVLEYLVRWPLAVLVTAAEHDDLPRKIYNILTFGPEHKAGVVPVGLVAFDFNPSVGVYAFWNDALFDGNDLHLHVEAWPDDWLAGSLTERATIDAAHAVQLRVEAVRRPDHVFYGLGPDTRQSSQSRYGEDRLEAGARFEWRFWRSARLEVGSGVRAASTYGGHYGSDPSLEFEAARGAFAVPYGFGRSFATEYNRVVVDLDGRPRVASRRAGPRVEIHAEQASDLRATRPSGWIRYGGAAGVFADLDGRRRVLAVAVSTEFVDPLRDQPIPFTELVSLGGDAPMRGYFSGRLVDRSAVAASAHYTWPIGPWLAGSLEVAAGNVFDEHLHGFRVERLRFSGDVGLSSAVTGDYPIEFVFGLGSETFERGATIDSVRVALSVNHGF